MTRLYWSVRELMQMFLITEQMVYYYARKIRNKVKHKHPGMFNYQELEAIKREVFKVRRGSKIRISKVMGGLGYAD